MSTVTSAISHIGLTPIANRYGIWPSGVQKWRDLGALPRTELAGLTDYASGIAELSEGKHTREELIRDTRAYWEKRRRQRKIRHAHA